MGRKFPGVENGVYGVSGVAKCSKISKTLRISTFLPFMPDFQGLQGLQGLQLNTPLAGPVRVRQCFILGQGGPDGQEANSVTGERQILKIPLFCPKMSRSDRVSAKKGFKKRACPGRVNDCPLNRISFLVLWAFFSGFCPVEHHFV